MLYLTTHLKALARGNIFDWQVHYPSWLSLQDMIRIGSVHGWESFRIPEKQGSQAVAK